MAVHEDSTGNGANTSHSLTLGHLGTSQSVAELAGHSVPFPAASAQRAYAPQAGLDEHAMLPA